MDSSILHPFTEHLFSPYPVAVTVASTEGQSTQRTDRPKPWDVNTKIPGSANRTSPFNTQDLLSSKQLALLSPFYREEKLRHRTF